LGVVGIEAILICFVLMVLTIFLSFNTGKTLRGHESEVNCVAFSPDGKLLATGSNDNTLRVWDAKTGSIVHILPQHDDSVTSVVFSPDGRYVATGCEDEKTRVWRVVNGEQIYIFPGEFALRFSADSQYVYSADKDSTVYKCRVEEFEDGKREEERTYQRKEGGIDCKFAPSLSSDCRYLLSAGAHEIQVWDIETGESYRSFSFDKSVAYGLDAVTMSQDGTLLAATRLDELTIWNLTTGEKISNIENIDVVPFFIETLCFSPDGRYLGVTLRSRYAHIIEIDSGEIDHRSYRHIYRVTASTFSPDGNYLATGCLDNTATGNTATIWRVK